MPKKQKGITRPAANELSDAELENATGGLSPNQRLDKTLGVVGDWNGDGIDDIITGAGPGAGPHVRRGKFP